MRSTATSPLVIALIACVGLHIASAVGDNPGSWGPLIPFPVIPVAAAVMPNNKLVVWAAEYPDAFVLHGPGITQWAEMDITTHQVSTLRTSHTNQNMFCPGTVQLADGRLFVIGGSATNSTSFFDPQTDLWTPGPSMFYQRGYASAVTLSDGRVFTIGGSWGLRQLDRLAEVWNGKGWTVLHGINPTSYYMTAPGAVESKDQYPWLFALPGGEIFQAGPSKQMNFFTTLGAGSNRTAGYRTRDRDSAYGGAVMYQPFEILTMGGAEGTHSVTATNFVHRIVLSNTTPSRVLSVTPLPGMWHRRIFHNAVVLPDGDVLVLGGQVVAAPYTDYLAVREPELWDHTTMTWRQLAWTQSARPYHSVALLLPDGRVFSGGGGLCAPPVTWCPPATVNHQDGQIFTPPYLLEADGKTLAPRPVLSNVPPTIRNGEVMTLITNVPCTFAMLRVASATHSINTDQRRVPLLPLMTNGTRYSVQVPYSRGVATPGYYMLFALNARGVPSLAKFVHVLWP